jgi:hypothetical protein
MKQARVDYVLNNKTIMGHAPKASATAYHSMTLCSFFMKQNKNGTVPIDTIWWKGYSKSLQMFNLTDE